MKRIFTAIILFSLILIFNTAHAQQGAGVFTVASGNCSSILSPVVNNTICITPSGVFVWNGSSYATVTNGVFPLSANSSASGYKITNLAPNTTTGDALSQAQSHLNDLATATAAYSMGGNLLTNLAGATALGQALSWGQNQAQLTANLPATVVSNASTTGNNVTTATIPAPATITNGNALVLVGSFDSVAIGSSGPGTITLPSGFTLIRNDTTGANLTAIVACKIANNESGSYTLSWVTGTQFSGAIVNISGASCTVDASNGVGSAASGTVTATAPALVLTEGNDLVLGVASGMGGDGVVASGNYGALVASPSSSFVGTSIYQSTPTGLASQLFTATSSSYVLAQQVALVPSQTLQSAPLVTGQQGAHLQSLTAQVNKVLNVQAPPYNAQGDGNTDDTSAIQEALDDSCGGVPPNFNSGQLTPGSKGATVYIPATLNGYVISAPLRVYCSEKIKAEPGTKILRAFGGSAALLVEGYGDNLLTYGPSLVGSGGNSLTGGATCSPSSNCGPINLDTFLNAKHFGVTFAQQAASNGFQIDFWMKAADTGNYNIIGSYCPYTYPVGACTNGMFQFNDSAGTAINAYVETTGGQIALSCTGQTLTNATLVTLSWDKSNYRLFANGTVCQTVASTNAPVMSVWESAVLPDYTGMQQWGGSGGYLNNIPLNGWLDSIRFEFQALNTTNFTPPTTKFAADGNTYLLWNPGGGEDGTAEAQTSSSFNVPIYFQTLNGAEGSNAATGVVVDGGNWCGGDINANGYATGDALFASWSVGSTFKNMNCPNASFIGYDFRGNDYFDTVEHNSAGGVGGGHVGFNFGNAFNSSYAIRNSSDMADMTCFVEAGNEFYEDYNHCTDRGGLWMYEDVVAAQGGGYIGNFFADAEAANTTQVAGLKIQQISLPVTLNSFDINTRNGAPYLLLDAPNASVVVENPAWDTYGESTPAVDLIKFTSAPTTSDAPVTILGGDTFPSGVPVSNYPAFVQLLGSANNTLGSLTLQNAPTLDAGLNNVVIQALANPSAPTITQGGTAGSTTYDYYVVCHSPNAGISNVSVVGATTTGNATLSSTNYNVIAYSCPTGYISADILKTNTSTSLDLALSPSGTLDDTGQATATYVPPTANTTGNLTVNGLGFSPSAVTVSGATTLSFNVNSLIQATLAASATLTIGPLDNSIGILDVAENSTGGFTPTFAAASGNTLVWSGGTTPTPNTGASIHNIYLFYPGAGTDVIVGQMLSAGGTAGSTSYCTGPDVTLSSGAGTFSNSCITTSTFCLCRDTTTNNDSCITANPVAGSVGLSGTGSDVIQVACWNVP